MFSCIVIRYLLITLFLSLELVAYITGETVISCDTFDSQSIKLVTFDVFAALMDLDSKFVSYYAIHVLFC
jgi:hypothetical protein